ncbi:MAG: AMP-binding protein [Bacteroidales bacterium]
MDKIKCPKIEGMIILEEIMASISTAQKLKGALLSKLPTKQIIKRVAQGAQEDCATILFTSGSEKEPKAVQLTHKNLISNIVNFSNWIGIGPTDKILANLVFFHVFGLTANLWVTLYHGMTMVTYANPLDFAVISTIAREEKPTVMVGTPSFFWGYLKKSKKGDFKSLRLMVAGADKCPDALREGYLKKHGVTLLEGYGATETSPVVSTNSLEYNRPGSIGKPIPGVEVKILDPDTNQECEAGVVGVIHVKGDLVMKGYYNEPQLTAEVLKDGWYNTGDMGYLDSDGYLWHSGRLKRFVKIGGEMVSLVRVEDSLEKLLPQGVSCCVVDIYDQVRGSSIVAAVTKEINRVDIVKELAKEIPNIALPKHFVVVEELPMMGTGKVDFRSVTKIVEERLSQQEGESN